MSFNESIVKLCDEKYAELSVIVYRMLIQRYNNDVILPLQQD